MVAPTHKLMPHVQCMDSSKSLHYRHIWWLKEQPGSIRGGPGIEGVCTYVAFQERGGREERNIPLLGRQGVMETLCFRSEGGRNDNTPQYKVREREE